MTGCELLLQLLIDGAEDAAAPTRALLAAGVVRREIVTRAFLPAVDEVASRMKDGRFALLDVARSAAALRACLVALRPEVAAAPLGVIVTGTPKGEIHDLGGKAVGLLLQGAGFEVHEAGTDVPPRAFVDAATAYGAGFVVLSGMLTTTVEGMRRVVEALAEAGLRERVKVLVGGVGVRAGAVERIGADAGCLGAAEAVAAAWELAGVSF
jgi:methanogenic corrinoid protein MtbC1